LPGPISAGAGEDAAGGFEWQEDDYHFPLVPAARPRPFGRIHFTWVEQATSDRLSLGLTLGRLL
jgi:hypothetical protein